MSPTRAGLPCRHHSCPAVLPKSGYCAAHQRAEYKHQDLNRPTAAARGYDSRWAKARKTYLVRHPLCVQCTSEGRVTAARVVDHIIPHRGDQALFWDSTHNWQSMCDHHHNVKRQRESMEARKCVS